MANRRRVYFNEYNIRMENAAYLPIASGLLRAYAETFDELRGGYEFMPFFYHVDSVENILRGYRDPAVAAFSLSMWNEQLNLTVAAEVKRRWPDCLIVVGGPQVPQHPQEYFGRYPFMDVAVRAEGEEPFAQVLLRNLGSREFGGIPSVSWRNGAEVIRNDVEAQQPKDLDMYPSPYIEGLFDEIMATSGMEMQAIIETNRGCPFPCAFCFWGQGGLSRKYRFHSIDRMRREIEWCAKNRIRYVFNADSNFGMHKRDEEIAQILVNTKAQYGFPEKFRTCFGKNADDRIYGIAKQLHAADMEKGITLALQSNNEQVLKNIRRQNIKLSAYRELQTRFNEANVPVYSELILGLPGETLETWKAGIDALLAAGLKNQLFVYLCQVYPNTEMSEPEYQKRFGIVTKRIELNETHGAVRSTDLVTEYEDVIVTTDAMPLAMWREMVLFSWWMMVLHSLKIGFFVMLYAARRHGKSYSDFIAHVAIATSPILAGETAEFNWQIDRLLEGRGRGRVMPGYGAMYWDEEEASFIRIAERLDAFYAELLECTAQFLPGCDREELEDVIAYQRAAIPSAHDPLGKILGFAHNVPEYFERALTAVPVELEKRPQTVRVLTKQFPSSELFAKRTIMWGRKSGTILNAFSDESDLQRGKRAA